MKEEKKHNKQEVCYICRKEFNADDSDKKYHKVRDHCHYTGKYRGVAHDICNLRYKIPKEISVVFHNGSTYDYHFIIKNLAEEFEGEFECLGENTEKCITFSVPIKKEITKKDKIVKISYKIKIKFIDSYRFMSTSLSKLVNNLSEGLHNDECKDCKSYLDYMTTKDEKLIFRCFSCKKNYEKGFNKDLIQRFANICEFCNGDLNKFILFLRKGVYPYEYMDSWQRFDETSLPDKEAFYSNLNMEDITDVDYRQNLDANNLYGWAMSQKLPVSGFKWEKNMSKFTKEFIKNYDEDRDKGYILEVDVKYPKKIHDLHSDLPFSPERMKIDKCKKLVCNLYNKKKYVVHIRS